MTSLLTFLPRKRRLQIDQRICAEIYILNLNVTSAMLKSIDIQSLKFLLIQTNIQSEDANANSARVTADVFAGRMLYI